MLFEESILSVECKKIYSHQMSQMNYENHEFHSMIKDKGSDHKSKHSDKYIFYTLRFDCSFAAANTIKPQLL